MNEEEACCCSRSSYGVPFYTRPLGTMFGCTGGLFGPAGFAALRPLLLLRLRSLAYKSRGVYVEELLNGHEEMLQSEASNDQQHIVEHPDDDDGDLMHQSGDHLLHEALSGDGDTQFHERKNSFGNLRMGHDGLGNLCCCFSSQQLGQVHAVIKKRSITCTESDFKTGYLEPSRKQLKS